MFLYPYCAAFSFGSFQFNNIYYFALFAFVIFIFLLITNFKTILRSFKGVNKQTWLILILIFLIGFWLRNAEYRYGMGLDGYVYFNSAKYLHESHIYTNGCLIGNDYDCRYYGWLSVPPGYQFLITIPFSIFGEYDIFSMFISGFLSSLTIILIFLIAFCLFKNEKLGLYSSAIFVFLPLDIITSPTGAVRSTSLFFIALAVLFYLLAIKKSNVKMWSLFAITLSYSIYVRQENVILLIPMAAGLFLFKYVKKEHLKKRNILPFIKKFSIPISIFLLTQAPVFYWILCVYGEGSFAVSNSMIIVGDMFNTFFQPTYYIPLVSILFFLSLVFITIRKHRSNLIFLLIPFFIYFLGISMFYQCEGFPKVFCLNYLRYMQSLGVFYSILAGFTMLKIDSGLEKVFAFKKIFFWLFLVVLIFLSFSMFKPSIFLDARLNEYPVGASVELINSAPANILLIIDQHPLCFTDMTRNDERRWINTPLLPFNESKQEIREAVSAQRPIYLLSRNIAVRCFAGRVVFGDEDICGFVKENFNLTLEGAVKDIEMYRVALLNGFYY